MRDLGSRLKLQDQLDQLKSHWLVWLAWLSICAQEARRMRLVDATRRGTAQAAHPIPKATLRRRMPSAEAAGARRRQRAPTILHKNPEEEDAGALYRNLLAAAADSGPGQVKLVHIERSLCASRPATVPCRVFVRTQVRLSGLWCGRLAQAAAVQLAAELLHHVL